MDYAAVDILLVEDNPHEAQLTIRSLKNNNLANNLHHVDDGARSPGFYFLPGENMPPEKIGNSLKVILLDLKLPKVDGPGSFKGCKRR